jgi:hypothetical protein
MIFAKKSTQPRGVASFAIVLFILLSLILSSCPTPIDDSLASQVEDTTPPVITIVNPDLSSTYYYPAVIVVDGIVADFVDSAGSSQGSVESLHFEEQYDKRVQGDVAVAADGSFSFSINTYGPPALQGTLYIVVTATDWNGNVGEVTIPAFDKTTGPDITMLGDTPGLYDYSSALPGVIYFDGVVDPSAFYLRYSMENPEGTIRISDQNIGFGVNGNFTIAFDPDSPVVSGTVKFILEAFDGLESSRIFYVQDDPDPPQFDTVISEVEFNNTYIDLFFTEPIYHIGGIDPLETDFTATPVTVPGGTATMGGFVGTPVAGDDTVRLALTVTGTPTGSENLLITTSNITDKVGNPLSPTSISLELRDKTPPTVLQVRTDPAYQNNSYKSGTSIPIIVEFNEPINETLPLGLNLNTGASASYSSGGGSTELIFTYNVQTGENTAILNASTMSGTVADLGSNSVLNPVLPVTPNDLAAMSITIDTVPPATPVLTISDADMRISKEENQVGIPFSIQGEPNAQYTIDLTLCNLATGSPPLTGTIPVGGLVTGFRLETSEASGQDAIVALTVTDEALNDSPTVSESLYIATESPNPPVFDTLEHYTNNNLLEWDWHSGGGGNGTYRYAFSIPALSSATPTTDTIYSYTETIDGEYTLFVQENNIYDNWSDPASFSITLDRVDPVVTPPANITVVATGANGTPASNGTISAFLSGATANDAVDGSLSVTVGSYPPTFPVGITTVTFSATDSAGNTGTASATVTVENTIFGPDGGEVWATGTSHDITWAHDDAGNVRIELWKGGVYQSDIIGSTFDDGTYNWTIPSGLNAGADYRVRVVNLSAPSLYDDSDSNFTIEKITVTAPNGGQTWGADTTHSITWTSSGTGNVRIELFKGGSKDSDIDTSTTNDGTYSWAIPADTDPGNDYRIEVTSLAVSAATDQSNADFTINITVITPNGGEDWQQGTQHSLQWAGTDGNQVVIELYKGGVKDSDIKTTNNDGQTNWTIPAGQTPGSDYSIKMTTQTTPAYSDDSDAYFTISSP